MKPVLASLTQRMFIVVVFFFPTDQGSVSIAVEGVKLKMVEIRVKEEESINTGALLDLRLRREGLPTHDSGKWLEPGVQRPSEVVEDGDSLLSRCLDEWRRVRQEENFPLVATTMCVWCVGYPLLYFGLGLDGVSETTTTHAPHIWNTTLSIIHG